MARAKYLGESMEPEIKVGSHWERTVSTSNTKEVGEIVIVTSIDKYRVAYTDFNRCDILTFLERFKPRPDLDCSPEPTEFKVNISVNTKEHIDYMFNAGYRCAQRPDITFDYMYVNTATKKFELSYDQVAFANSGLPCRTVYEIVEPNQTTKEQPMNKLDLRLLTAIMQLIVTAEDEQLDATNSEFICVLTKDNNYEGYFYSNSVGDYTEVMQKVENAEKKLHVFKYQSTVAQKPRKIIEVGRS